MKKFLYTLSVLVCLLGVSADAWAVNGGTWISATSKNTAQGLVYASTSKTPSPTINQYTSPSESDEQTGGGSNVAKDFYIWAKPARGYYFTVWNGNTGQTKADSWTNTGNGDKIQGTTPRNQHVASNIVANFDVLPPYEVVYQQPIGGSYSVQYNYLTVDANAVQFVEDGQTLQLTPTSGNLKPEGNKTYSTDDITLSSGNANFAGWYKDGVLLSSVNPYTDYKAGADATISALFKTATLGSATGDLSPAVKALGSNDYTITVPVTAHGEWSTSDFTVSFAEQTSPARGDVTKGTVTYSQTSGDVLSSAGTLTIPFTYNPASWGNTDVLVTVTPLTGGMYGTSISFHILASATEPVTEEAQLWENGVKTQSGTLAAMVAAANALSTKPVVKLMQDKTIDAPLSLTKSMKFDLNDKKITSTGASAFSIDAASIDVQIVDEGFGGIGEIATSSAQSGNVSVVGFTQKAKLTMQGGTLSATNTGSGSAYGINVTQGSTFYMTDGYLTVTCTNEAHGVHVATTSDYATLNGGSITVTTPTNAYGVWSAGQSNITGATIAAETTTGTNAYGVYVNDGVSTLTSNTISATAKTTSAYAAYVNSGRLNGNGGNFVAEAVASGAYGVHVQAGAEAMLQMNAVVTAEATGVNGTSVFGVNNLGTVSLTNVSVTATSPTTAATAVNTATSAIFTTIEGGTYRANTTGGTAYGLHHQYGALNVDGGEFKAVGGGNSIYGARAMVDATIANATMHGETIGSGNTAYGFVGGVENKNITLTNCSIEAISNTSIAYAVYSRANVSATNCTLEAKTYGGEDARGFHAETGTNQLTNCNATVSSYTIKGYGVYHKAGTLTINGGIFDVEVKQSIASAAQTAELGGIYNAASQTTTIDGATFNATASNNTWSQYAYAAHINGVLNSTNATYSATGRTSTFAVYGLGSSTLNLSGNTITSRVTNGTKSYGIYAKKNFTIDGDIVNAIGNTTEVYAMFFDANNSVGEVKDGKFSAQGNGTNSYGALNAAGTANNVKLKGGVYKTTINLQKYTYTGYQLFHLDETHADYADGYRYIIATENPSPYVCRIVGGAYYTTLEAALQYTLDNSGSNYTIVMTQNYTLPAGEYTLPSNATLIVPRESGQTSITKDNPTNPSMPDRRTIVGLREDFIRLTFAANAHLNVNGKIGVSGEMYCKESSYTGYNNTPFGRIHMESGSLIQLNSGAYLYAWGFITGAGNIIVKNNAEVHEMFQVGDMQTVGNLADGYYGNSHGHFLINQYCLPNIEVPTTYYYNSRLIGAMYSYYAGTSSYQGGNAIKVIGTQGALFEVTANNESSWVRKSYDATHDYQIWDVNSSAQLGSIKMTVSSQTINSLDYILPITSNMKIHVLDGEFKITQSTEFLPGSSVEVDKTASITINETYKNSHNSTKNLKVYVFDSNQWPLSTANCSPAYSPSWPNGSKPTRTANDAAFNVHGNINVLGSLYTTKELAGGTNATYGANIYSNNADAGTISFESAAPSTTTSINVITGVKDHNLVTKEVTMDPALLKNGSGASPAFTSTSGTAADHSFAYMNNVWTSTYTNGCFEVVGENVYVKPSGYVQLKKTQTVGGYLEGVEEENHTYLTVDDKLLIQMDDCQWWEVEATSDPTVFECKKSGYEGFYYYDNSDSNHLKWTWKLKTVNVDFYSSETGSNVLKRIVTNFNGIPDQAVIASNPTKATTTGYTYQFYGWKSSVTGTEYKWTDQLEVATADMSYRPVFTETKRNYTITLKDANNGADVPLEVPYGETPEYTPKKDATAQYTYTFNGWSPAFQPVTGAATYTAQWTSTVNEYNITWKNGDDVLEVDENQPYGTATAYNGASLPTKASDDDYEYAFSKWKSSLNGNLYNNGSTPTVAGETTYEAQYTTTPRYAVTFNNYDGTQLARTIYTQGLIPSYDGLPTRKRDSDGYFKFIGWKNSNGDDYAANITLPAVTKKETYTAQYEYVTDLYTVTLRNVKGQGAAEGDNIWSGKFGVGSTPFYDPNEDDVPDTPTKAGNVQYSYPFNGWSLTQDGEKLDPVPEVTGVATYWALFTQTTNKYTITFANIDGHDAEDIVEVEYGSTPVCTNLTSAYYVGQQMYLFRAWKRSSDQLEYTTLPDVVGDEIYTAQYDPVENLDVDDDKTINSDASVGITIVRQTGKLTLTSGKTLTTSDLILEASESASGQIMETGTITATNVYYDLKLNTDARHWHAFGVPWAVDINANELQEVDNGGNVVRTLRISHDYEIVYFDGEERAANGPSSNCWKYLRHYEDTEHGQPVDELIPGHGYMIAFASHVNTVRFVKKSGAPIIFDGSVGVTAHQICGISNPMAYHTTISNMGAVVGQVHDGGEIGHDDYDIVDELDEKRFVVGKTVFIEPSATIPAVTITKANGSESPVAAPARRDVATDKKCLTLSDYYTIALTPEDGSRAAKVYVLPEEDKEDKYVAGHDLAKMGMSDRKAQIWVERYEAQLGLNTTAPIKEVATFPINLYAPKAGEYIISLASQPNDEYTVYLMRDGAIIWNLSRSGYAITLDAGTDKTYSLRLTHKSPGVMIDIEEELVDAQGETSKVIINGKVFIIRGNQVYSIDGQIVKFGNNND